jgi:hypothetical protein
MWAMLNNYEINPGTPYTAKSMPEYKGRPYGGDVKQYGSEWVMVCEPGQSTTGGSGDAPTTTHEDKPF